MPEFGDITPEDVVTSDDEKVDWGRVEDIKTQIDEIQEIKDPDDRLKAAKEWSSKLGGSG